MQLPFSYDSSAFLQEDDHLVCGCAQKKKKNFIIALIPVLVKILEGAPLPYHMALHLD